jgi:hypothetical protein
MSKITAFLFCMAISFFASANSGRAQSPYPILGRIVDGSLHIPTFKTHHDIILNKIYAYVNGTEIIATLSSKNRYIETKREMNEKPDDQSVGSFVYNFDWNGKVANSDKVLVFDQKQNIKQTATDTYAGLDSDRSWNIISVDSSEGYHLILQTIEKGQCVRHVDYYYHVAYDIESDHSSDERLKKACCGVRVEPVNIHP